ncbi:MAG TPA: hypothetical protein VEQ59_06585, partial [Polyangiaceae bacterium]|nr:hypothetical protein [Polyangiaceae bacterium]
MAPLRSRIGAALATLVLGGCDAHGSSPSGPAAAPLGAAKKKPKPKPSEEAPRELEADDAAPVPHAEAKNKPKPPRPLAANEKDDKPVENSRYLLDGLNDVGPAAPAAAFAHGVVLITRDDELAISRLTAAPSKSKKPVAGAFEELARGRQDFWPVARGPAVSATHAYWVSKGRVVRRALAGGELEVLATDARDGTRVAVAGSPDVV